MGAHTGQWSDTGSFLSFVRPSLITLPKMWSSYPHWPLQIHMLSYCSVSVGRIRGILYPAPLKTLNTWMQRKSTNLITLMYMHIIELTICNIRHVEVSQKNDSFGTFARKRIFILTAEVTCFITVTLIFKQIYQCKYLIIPRGGELQWVLSTNNNNLYCANVELNFCITIPCSSHQSLAIDLSGAHSPQQMWSHSPIIHKITDFEYL